MDNTLRRILIAGCLLLTGNAALPAPFENARHLSMTTLVDAVLAHNSGLKEKAAVREAAKYRIEPAGALDDPRLSYAVAPKTAGGPRTLQQKAELSQSLPWPGKLDLREKRAHARARAEAVSFEDSRLQLAAAAKGLFAEWAYVHRTLGIKQEQQVLLRELQQVAETRYSAGKAPQRDALQAEVEQARVQTEIVTHRRHRREVQARINALLNRHPDTRLPPPAELPEPIALPSLEGLQRFAVREHPELQRIRARIKAARADHDLAKKDRFPDFRLSAGYNSLWRDTDQRWTVGVSVNLPFDFSDKRSSEVDATKAEVMRFDWRLSDREARLLSELAQNRARVLEAEEIMTIYRERLVPLARESLDTAIADYRAGRGSFLAVIDAERAQLRTEDSLARAQADYLRQLAALERYAGRSLTDGAATSNPNNTDGAEPRATSTR